MEKEGVRPAKAAEVAQLQTLYDRGRSFQLASGNRNQWAPGYPGEDQLRADHQAENLYVLVDETDQILAAMALIPGQDPTYSRIEGGQWLNQAPYVTIHRLVSAGRRSGAGRRLLEWATHHYPNIRIDTHPDNQTMRQLLNQLGFVYCGIIYLVSGDKREAYQFLKEERHHVKRI